MPITIGWLTIAHITIQTMINELRIPQILTEQRGYCLRIDENNGKLFNYIEYLKLMVTGMHAIYQRLCKRVLAATEDAERRMLAGKATNAHGLVMLNFVRGVSLLHLTISNQLSSNSVALGTKSHKVARNRLEILREKLVACDGLNRQYLEMVEVFNKKERSLREKCDYFNDYEKDVLKYYSLKANTELYDKLSHKELKLRARLQEIGRCKEEYKINIAEIRVTIKEYYEMELALLAEYKRLLLNIRKNNATRQVYNQPIIEEQSEEAASTVQDAQQTSRRTERTRAVVQLRRDIIKEYQRMSEAEEVFEELVRTLQEELDAAGLRIDELRAAKDYQTFTAERLIMAEILSPESLRDVDMITNELAFFRTIILRLGSVFGKTKVLAELKKYRGFNFDKFVEDTNNFAEQERKSGESPALRAEYLAVQQRFLSSHNQYNAQYQARVGELLEIIKAHYYLEQSGSEENQGRGRRGKGDLFEKKYYQILMIPFFLSKQESFSYQENPYLKKFGAHISANRIQQMMTLTGFPHKPIRAKTACCGLIRTQPQPEQAKPIDEFHCALKDGLILVQGKLRLFENYINFSSKFNSKTIFGYSDIRVPKWDIVAFSEDRHLLSMMVVLETKHGAIGFTSFLTNPLQLLQSTYSNRRSGVSVLQHPHAESELQLLEARFQGELRGVLKRRGMAIDKLSTYLSEDGESLSICLEFRQAGALDSSLFEIKIINSELQLEYMFIHDQQQRSQEVRSWLEAAAKELINRRADPPSEQPPPNNNQSLDLEYSIIVPNERNKISFLREPSFLNKKSEIEEPIRASQIDCGPLLTSRNFINNGETSKNIELLEQRMSEPNEEQETHRTSLSKFLPLEASPTRTHIHTGTITPPQLTPPTPHAPSQAAPLQAEKSVRVRKPSSARSSVSSGSSSQACDYKTILLVLGILLGVNLILQAVSP